MELGGGWELTLYLDGVENGGGVVPSMRRARVGRIMANSSLRFYNRRTDTPRIEMTIQVVSILIG